MAALIMLSFLGCKLTTRQARGRYLIATVTPDANVVEHPGRVSDLTVARRKARKLSEELPGRTVIVDTHTTGTLIPL